MSIWTTKSSGRDRNYIVLQHPLRGVNYYVNGVKFRDGFAVVEKNTKTYKMLRSIPVLRGAKEHELVFLKKLKFITSSSDVRTVYGSDVYEHYMKQLTVHLEEVKVQEEIVKQEAVVEKHIKSNKCAHTNASGELCGVEALESSPSGYCHFHILQDPKLSELGIEVPRFLSKKEKKELKERILKKLEK